MAAVNIRLSRQDAKYLVGLLDAVSRATMPMELREPRPARYNRVETIKAVRERLNLWRDGAGSLDLAQALIEAIEPHLAGSDPQQDVLMRRAQTLANSLPLGDLRSAHVLGIRLGAAVLTATNIADEHSE